MPIPAAARLVEFSCSGRRSEATRHSDVHAIEPAAAPQSPVDREAERVAAAFLRGRNEGLDTARAEHQARSWRPKPHSRSAWALQRALWAGDQGAALAERVELPFAALSTDVSDAVAAILSPFIEDALRARVVEELLRTLEKLLKGGRPASLKISGPEDIARVGAQDAR